MAESREQSRGLLHRVKGVLAGHRNGESSGLRTVKDPRAANIDILAVHGLGGEGFRSWITLDAKAGNSKSWLEELLAKDVPNARIMTYGYVSESVNYRYLVRNVLYGRALDLVRELGGLRQRDGTTRRPIFFIAHSLGGWIVKRALIISSEATDLQLRDVELSTCGVAFFGTLSPNRKVSPSPLTHVIHRTNSLSINDPGRSRPADSEQFPSHSDGDWLESQLEAFKAITANLPKVSFYETKQSQHGFIVEKKNSMLGSDGSQIGLASTHSQLVRFNGRDPNYRTFLSSFKELLNSSATSDALRAKRRDYDLTAVHQLEYLKSDFSLPWAIPPGSHAVIRRQELMDALDSALDLSLGPKSLHPSIVSLWGAPGTGKTTLAKSYAEQHKHDISCVFWIFAESRETVISSYLQFANDLVLHYTSKAPRDRVENDLGLNGVENMLKVKSVAELDSVHVKSVTQAVKDWLLRPENSRWLMIFDNVESSYDIYSFMPLTLSGRIILTSRDPNCCSWGSKINVREMIPAEGLEVMETILGKPLEDNPVESEAAIRILQHASHNPLAIAMAASRIRNQGLTVAKYLEEIERQKPPRFLGTAIDQSPYAKTILRVSAMLSSSFIPVALFTIENLKQVPSKVVRAFDELKIPQNIAHLDDVLRNLVDNNFISSPTSSDESSPTGSRTSMDTFIMDVEAREHVRSSLTPAEEVEQAWMACNVCIGGIRAQETTSTTLPEVHGFGRIMAPHAKVCYEDWSKILSDMAEDNVAWHVLGNVCMTQGAIQQAIGCFELSLKHKSRMEPIEVIQTSLSLASLLQQSGQHKKSSDIITNIDIQSIDQAIGFRVSLAKASVAVAEGNLDTAEDEYESLEHQQEEALGPADMSTVITVQRLASTLEQLHKVEEALALYRRVYISYRNIFGKAHPITLEALEDLAHVYLSSNAVDDAESLYKQAVEIRTSHLGADHPSTANALQKLAIIDDMRCRYLEAQIKYLAALEIMSKTIGRAHPLYVTVKENMALSSRWQGHGLSDDEVDYSRRRRKSNRSSEDRRHSTNSQFLGTMNPRTVASKAPELPSSTVAIQRKEAFDTAERLYLDVLAIKKSARDLYSDEQVLETGSKLEEMYENEEYFSESRNEKLAKLLSLLREPRKK